MPWREHDDWRFLERIACSLENIEEILEAAFQQPNIKARSVNVMPLPTGPVAPGTSDTATGTAVDASGNTVVDATVTWTSSDDTLLTVVDNGSNAGVGSVTWTALGDGGVLTSVGTNADGTTTSTGTNNPFTFSVTAPVDEATLVNVV